MAKLVIEQGSNRVLVSLSERNLLALLTKLYTDGSECTLENNVTDPDGLLLVLKAEKDKEHYDDPARLAARGRPGRMHSVTEEIIQSVRQAVKGRSILERAD